MLCDIALESRYRNVCLNRSYRRGEQIAGIRSLWRLNFAWWRLASVGLQCGNFVLIFRSIEFWSGTQVLGGDLCILLKPICWHQMLSLIADAFWCKGLKPYGTEVRFLFSPFSINSVEDPYTGNLRFLHIMAPFGKHLTENSPELLSGKLWFNPVRRNPSRKCRKCQNVFLYWKEIQLQSIKAFLGKKKCLLKELWRRRPFKSRQNISRYVWGRTSLLVTLDASWEHVGGRKERGLT